MVTLQELYDQAGAALKQLDGGTEIEVKTQHREVPDDLEGVSMRVDLSPEALEMKMGALVLVTKKR